MPTQGISRRRFLTTTSTAVAGLPILANATMTHAKQLPTSGDFPVKVISSANGLRAGRQRKW